LLLLLHSYGLQACFAVAVDPFVVAAAAAMLMHVVAAAWWQCCLSM